MLVMGKHCGEVTMDSRWTVARALRRSICKSADRPAFHNVEDGIPAETQTDDSFSVGPTFVDERQHI
jgi:hypothetical protein